MNTYRIVDDKGIVMREINGYWNAYNVLQEMKFQANQKRVCDVEYRLVKVSFKRII